MIIRTAADPGWDMASHLVRRTGSPRSRIRWIVMLSISELGEILQGV